MRFEAQPNPKEEQRRLRKKQLAQLRRWSLLSKNRLLVLATELKKKHSNAFFIASQIQNEADSLKTFQARIHALLSKVNEEKLLKGVYRRVGKV